MNQVLCVYSSSSCAIDRKYFELAEELGENITRRGDQLLFGGGLVGLMGAVAESVQKHGGKVIGVIPKALNVAGIVFDHCDELIVTEGLRERKATMDARSDAFIALPGGYGTLEECLEIITLKQLRYHNKPIIIINLDHFYQPLLDQFERFVSERFAKPECRKLYAVVTSVPEAMEYLDHYQPYQFEGKWMTDVERSR
ncbi:MAG TPA: TIGR00730 family Rossman fold protein [Bacillota bacterium]|nr:TIGR00730 family Rossman fold protein [Bacillota bacterium]